MPPYPDPLTVSMITGDSAVEFPWPVDSEYVERFWLPVVGPAVLATTRLLYRSVVTTQYPNHQVTFGDLAAACGISSRRFRGTLDRANKFRFVQFIPETGRLAVYQRVRWVGVHASYPPALAADHRALQDMVAESRQHPGRDLELAPPTMKAPLAARTRP